MPRSKLFTIAALLVAAGFAAPAAAQEPASLPLPGDAELRALLAERVDAERRNVGIVVGVLTPTERRVVSYGRVSLDSADAPSGDTVFEIGSLTKVFTSMLLADAVRRGSVQLSEPLGALLPEAKVRPNAAGRTITLVDLATHTSGLPLWPSDLPATREGALAMATYSEARLFDYLSAFAVADDVGVKWSYSNLDAGLLGLALARRAGTTYEALVQTKIIGPLGMRSTAVAPSRAMARRLAAGYDAKLERAPRWNVPALPGAGSLHSTVNDLLKLLDAISRDAPPVAGLTSTMLETRRSGPGIPQALAWWIIATSPADAGILTHDGGTLGFASSIGYDPAARVGVVVLSNTQSGVGDIARHLLRPVIPLTKPAAPAPQRTEISLDPAVLDRYVGRYAPAAGVVFEVTRDGSSLALALPGIPPLRLAAETERAFFVAADARTTVTFDVDAAGRAQSLSLHSAAGDTVAARVENP